MSDAEELLRERLRGVFGRQFEELSSLRTTPGGRRLASSLRLWEIYVPLRSNLTLDLVLNADEPAEFCIHQNERQILSGPMQRQPETVRERRRWDTAQQIGLAVQRMVTSGDTPGLSLEPLPIISAPIWAPGNKPSFCTIEVAAATALFDHVVLLGPPGSGKSTIARLLACALMGPYLVQDSVDASFVGCWPEQHTYMPVFVEMKTMTESEGWPQVTEAARADDYLRFVKDAIFGGDELLLGHLSSCMDDGTAVLIFDGLDEVPVPLEVPDALELRRDQMRALFDSLRTRYPNARIVITSRPAGYSGWSLSGFETIRILPLRYAEALQLASAAFKAHGVPSSQVAAKTDRLSTHLARIPDTLREQALFVVLLALIFLDEQNSLPSQRGALLARSIDLMLGVWAGERVGQRGVQQQLGCTDDDLLECLQSLALRASESGIGLGELRKDIGLGIVLEELYELGSYVSIHLALEYISQHAGLLISPSRNKFRFAHRLFQEYLTAAAVVKKSDAIEYLVGNCRRNPASWSEIAELAADILANESRTNDLWGLVQELCDADDRDTPDRCGPRIEIASTVVLDQGLDSSRGLGRRLSAGVREALSQCVSSSLLSPESRSQVGAALGHLGDSRAGVGVNDGTPDIAWVEIPAGQFSMGLGNELPALLTWPGAESWDFSRERPASDVTVQAFGIAAYPVTVAQFQSFIRADDGFWDGRWWAPRELAWRDAVGSSPSAMDPTMHNCPQVYVSWFEARAFARWLSARLGFLVRLPTEPEWEWAARGPKLRVFPWGAEPDPLQANVLATGIGRLASVGLFRDFEGVWGQAGPYDMVGNCWEWVSTVVETMGGIRHYPYRGDWESEPDSPGMRVGTRGGYFGNDFLVARASYRGRDDPSVRLGRQGFRLARNRE